MDLPEPDRPDDDGDLALALPFIYYAMSRGYLAQVFSDFCFTVLPALVATALHPFCEQEGSHRVIAHRRLTCGACAWYYVPDEDYRVGFRSYRRRVYLKDESRWKSIPRRRYTGLRDSHNNTPDGTSMQDGFSAMTRQRTLHWLCWQPTPYNSYLFCALTATPQIDLHVHFISSVVSSPFGDVSRAGFCIAATTVLGIDGHLLRLAARNCGRFSSSPAGTMSPCNWLWHCWQSDRGPSPSGPIPLISTQPGRAARRSFARISCGGCSSGRWAFWGRGSRPFRRSSTWVVRRTSSPTFRFSWILRCGPVAERMLEAGGRRLRGLFPRGGCRTR